VSTASLLRVPSARPTVSFEVYPPRTPAGAEAAWETITRLATAAPDFFSVTYGASGSSRAASRAVVRRVLTHTTVPPIAHLTCVDATREELAALVGELLDDGVRDFLALRGDPPAGASEWVPVPGGLNRASELVELIREVELARFGATGEVSIAVAAYPAGSSHTRAQDIEALRAKQEAGADFAITQVFYDAADYAGLVEDARNAGIVLPVVAGVIPATDPRRLARLAELTGVVVPPALLELLAVDDEEERHARGVTATLELIDAVVAAGAPGLHVYTFNHHRPALDVVERLHRPAPLAAPLPTPTA
jgi:methylenetetrahydrofolate reductase (NADPH)